MYTSQTYANVTRWDLWPRRVTLSVANADVSPVLEVDNAIVVWRISGASAGSHRAPVLPGVYVSLPTDIIIIIINIFTVLIIIRPHDVSRRPHILPLSFFTDTPSFSSPNRPRWKYIRDCIVVIIGKCHSKISPFSAIISWVKMSQILSSTLIFRSVWVVTLPRFCWHERMLNICDEYRIVESS